MADEAPQGIPEIPADADMKQVVPLLMNGMATAYDASKGVEAVVQFDFGDDGQWYLTLGSDGATATEGQAENPRMTMSAASRDFIDMLTGKTDGQQMFMSGKLRIAGDMMFAMQMQGLFKAPEGLGG